jgi:hypothetical protein
MTAKYVVAASLISLCTACTQEPARAPESNDPSASAPSADYVFSNGRIFTSASASASAGAANAVAVKGEDIVYVGDNAGAAAHIGAATQAIDLDGRMLMPGFVDAHSHPIAGGLIMTGVDLQSDDVDEILRRIREHATSNPDEPLVQGYGVRFNPWNGNYPDAAMLDAIESERPVYLWTIDGHGAPTMGIYLTGRLLGDMGLFFVWTAYSIQRHTIDDVVQFSRAAKFRNFSPQSVSVFRALGTHQEPTRLVA